MKKLFLFLSSVLFILLCISFVNRFIFKSRASEEILQIFPELQTANAVVGEPFSAKIMLLGNADKRVSAVTVDINYDKSKLVFLGADEGDSSCTKFEHQIRLTDNASAGTITWSKVSFKGKNDLPQGLTCFGILRFKPIVAGSALITPLISTTIEAVGPSDTFAIRTNEKSVLTVTVSAGPYALSSCASFTETFSGNNFNQSLFAKGGTLAADQKAISVANNKLVMLAGSSSTESASLYTKNRVGTNFIAEISVDNFKSSTGSGAVAYIHFSSWNGATDYAGSSVELVHESNNTHYARLHVFKYGGKDYYSATPLILPNPTNRAKLKLVREGFVVKGYIDYGSGYQLIESVTAETAREGDIEAALWANWNSNANLSISSISLLCTSRSCIHNQSANTYACTYAENTKPLLFLKFDEGTGVIVSNSVDNNLVGSYAGAGVHWNNGKVGMAGNFEGDDDYVSIPDTDTFSAPSFTISGWYKWDGKRYATSTNKDSAALFSKGIFNTATDEYSLLLHRLDTSVDTNLTFYMNGQQVVYYPNSGLDTNWHYISVTYDGVSAKMFLDAKKVAENAVTVSINNSGSAFTLGAQSNASYPYGGMVDNFSFFTHARSEAQLSDDMKVENELVLPTPAPTQGVHGPKLELVLRLQGVGGKPVKDSAKVTVTVTKKDGTDPHKFENVEIKAQENGNWKGSVELGNMPIGEYRVLVKGSKHIQKKFCHGTPDPGTTGVDDCAGTAGIVISTGVTTLDATKIPLPPGDLSPQDGTLNANDVTRLMQHLFNSDSGALDLGDLNYDGVVNGNDFAIQLNSMAKNFTDE